MSAGVDSKVVTVSGGVDRAPDATIRGSRPGRRSLEHLPSMQELFPRPCPASKSSNKVQNAPWSSQDLVDT